ncbi:MAG: hypothetical protein QM270_07235 [Bacillota bacterium]|nr:hypothetical protein [Bacillota bacterium]
MKAGFEKEFTDIQIGLISLCLEAVSMNTDVVYAYAYIGEGSSMFNMFFERNGSIFPAYKLIQDSGLLSQALKYGTHDLEKLRSICVEYETMCPVEMRMYYNCKTKKFTADYTYETNDTAEFSPHDSFLEWRNEIASTKH